MTKPLTDRLRSALEFKDEDFHCQIGDNSTNAEIANEFIKPVLDCLIECVGELKSSIIIESTCEECGTFSGVRYEIREIKEALSKLDSLLREREKP